MDSRLRNILLVGALIGAILGTGAAYLLSTAPSDEEQDEPVTTAELLGITSMLALLARKMDTLRRKI